MKKREYHGHSKERLYRIWAGMRDRCYRKNNDDYQNYGARGIRVCDDWGEFSHFMAWALSNGYSENLTIDRIDVGGDYCPDNCRWVDIKIQANNRRNNHYISFAGKTQTLRQWSEELGIPYSTLRSRINLYKYPIEKAFSLETFDRKAEYYYKGETKRLYEWCKELNLPYGRVQRRLQLGWTIERALEEK